MPTNLDNNAEKEAVGDDNDASPPASPLSESDLKAMQHFLVSLPIYFNKVKSSKGEVGFAASSSSSFNKLSIGIRA